MEGASQLPGGKTPTTGLLVSLIFSATAGLGLTLIIQIPLLAALGLVPVTILFAPLIEEPVKALGMLIVFFFMWKTIPNRRYGAALGATSGLGFGVAESILYIAQLAAAGSAEGVFVRVVVTPLMHPLWSAFVGIGVFALFSGRSAQPDIKKSSPWLLSLLFVGLAMLTHCIWNTLSLGLSYAGLGYFATVPDIIVIFPIFALILRDFLGGHFNFQNFFESPSASSTVFPVFLPPPPPPPQ